MVVHPKASGEDIARLIDLFGIDVKISTANFGSPYLGASVVANDRGALIGNKSSGVEVNRIEDTLDLIE
jgi:translation initiation factor 6